MSQMSQEVRAPHKAKQADDDQLERMAQRIRARAIRRAGELLKQIEPGQGARDGKREAGDHPPLPSDAAREAGKPPPILASGAKDHLKAPLKVQDFL
ncbi:hypothetical protein [Paracoccus sp. J55]|uniref:hypothetical protein n=1 Tax=Paracoccus sp. J55 TaxID=935849 RepID=UPI000491304E|nr:hypothetical protein [Paracoccus sp. J55]